MTSQLSSSNREFFRRVAEAAFSNPFTSERVAADLAIAGLERDEPDRTQRVVQAVARRVAAVEATGLADIRRFVGEEREVMVVAFLFDLFHRFAADFDRLIQDQRKAGDEPVRVPFARSALDALAGRGFSSEGARHFLAVFYQLRRAYHFIDQGLVGASPCMRDLRRRLWSNVFTHDIAWYERFLWDRMEDFSTLLLGETGTGKGAAAAAIGRSGLIPYDERRGCFAESFTRSFVAINLSQFPQALIESELFGHKKGAFTGAIDHHDGVFARCSAHGAIFLDEIGDVSVPSQIKLLQLLQDRTFSPVGGHETLRFRGRVIAATNRPIDDLRRRGEIRDDFFYRLCSDVITLPPLRQRIEEDPSELERLVAVVVVRLTGDESPELTRHVSDALATTPGPRYRWPGNVRELEQAVRRVMITRRYDGETASPTTGSGPDIAADVEAGALTADELLSAYCARLYEKLGTYGAVAQRTRLDRRTVKKYIQSHEEAEPGRR